MISNLYLSSVIAKKIFAVVSLDDFFNNIQISVPLHGQLKINIGVSKCPPMCNIGINISYIFEFTKVN